MSLDPLLMLGARRSCFGCRSPGPWLCPRCEAAMVPPTEQAGIPGIDRVFSPWRYEGVGRDLVLALKLRHQRGAAEPLAAVVAAFVQSHGTRASTITWVPARRSDRRTRGFDHAELIARRVGAHLGLPASALLERTGRRPDQAGLGRTQRWANLGGAFTVRGSPPEVLLVDDLVTTGATAAASARALRTGGATHVELAAPCRA